jgi:uncharacterized membrane protein YcaP (DUF421 family)
VDLLRIVVRIVFTWLALQTFVRVSGKRTVRQATPFDFTLSMVLGDMMDDFIWAEVAASQFVIAVAMLFTAQIAVSLLIYRAGVRR